MGSGENSEEMSGNYQKEKTCNIHYLSLVSTKSATQL